MQAQGVKVGVSVTRHGVLSSNAVEKAVFKAHCGLYSLHKNQVATVP